MVGVTTVLKQGVNESSCEAAKNVLRNGDKRHDAESETVVTIVALV
jgi:hypothetical protein